MTPSLEILSKIKITPLLDTLHLEDIDDKIYFSAKYADYISNSRMSLINPAQNGSPEAYFEGLKKNGKYTSSLAFGSAVHMLSLQPESFYLCEDVFAPTAKVGMMADLLWGVSKNGELPNDEEIRKVAITVDYYKGMPTDNQMKKVKEAIKPYFKARYKFEQNSTDTRQPIYLDEKSKDKLLDVLDSLNKNKDIQKLLHPVDVLENELPSENEKTILLDIQVKVPEQEPFIMKLKAKLDNYTIDKMNNTITVNDVKTTGKMCSEFKDAVKNFHYYREIAFYSWLLSLCAKKFFKMKNPKVKGNFLVVETMKNPYWSSVETMKPNWFRVGTKEFLTLLQLIAYYKVYGYEKV
jgi:hypothetical protein